MGMSPGDYASEIERSQKTIEFILATVIPSLMALMLLSYFMFRDLVQVFLFLSIAVAVVMVVPAKKVQDLHYQCWARNTMPLKMVTSLIGMVYISAVSVFSVSLISAAQGLRWDHPLTFAVIIALLLALLILMTYSGRNKARFERTEKRLFRMTQEDLEESLAKFLEERGEKFTRTNGRGISFALEERGYHVEIQPLGVAGCEVFVEPLDSRATRLNGELKAFLESLV